MTLVAHLDIHIILAIMQFANLTLGWILSLAQSRVGVGSLVENKVVSNATLASATSMGYTLPPLDYAYDALEPHFDEETMRIHHTKHHQTYVNNLNAALGDMPELASLVPNSLMRRFEEVPTAQRKAVRNHGGGHANHAFFWKNLSSNATTLSGSLKDAIESNFSSFESFQQEFEKAAASVFGSGWAWLVLKPEGSLKVVTTANQDSPLMGASVVGDAAGSPIIGLDVWEHAYYLKYRNVRPDYIKA